MSNMTVEMRTKGDIAEKEIVEMLAMGVVEESHNRWACFVCNVDGLILFYQDFNC